MSLIHTTKGPLEESTLARTMNFRETPSEYVIEIEWRLGDELVKRSAHVILKEPSVIAECIVGSTG